MNLNKKKILITIYKNGAKSRKELSDILGVSKTIIGRYTKQLIEDNILIEEKEKIKGVVGKPQIKLNFKKNFGKILGVHLSDKEIRGGIGSLSGEMLEFSSINLEKISADLVLENLLKLIKKFIKRYKVEVISLGMNGVVDNKNGVSILSVYYNWKNVELKKILEKEFNIPVILENGTNLMALREKRNGLGKKLKNFIIFNIDEGVGAGIIVEENLYSGTKFEAGEIGHAPYDYSENAPICSCGNKGCLETYLANWRVIERVYKEKGIVLNYEEIIYRANKGETYFYNLILSLVKAISHGILWTEYLLNPEGIIITGKITECKDFFWKEVERVLNNNLLNKDKKICLLKSKYEKNAILEGAIFFGLDYYFNE